MRFYLGKGTELKKKACKEYKTLDGALKAAAKDESLVVWDENGNVITSTSSDDTEKTDRKTSSALEDTTVILQDKMKATVICDGTLNIRRSAAWGNDNICGHAVKGQSYHVKEMLVVDGKKMVRTIGDLYLSGESEHVQIN